MRRGARIGRARREGSTVSRKAILVLALIATLTIGVGVAFAAKKYSTKIQVDGVVRVTPTDETVFGHLQTNRKCLGPRLMQLSRKTSSGFSVIDQDYSSAHGAFAFKGDIDPLPANLRVEVAKAKLRNQRGHVKAVCKPDTFQFTVQPPS
jgi:hypothetical protein